MLNYVNNILCFILYLLLCFMHMNLCRNISKNIHIHEEMTRVGEKQKDKNIGNLKHFNQYVINEVTFF